MKNEKINWIITINNSEADEIELIRCTGTMSAVRKYLWKRIKDERDTIETESNKEILWEDGTESAKDIEVQKGNVLYALALYSGFMGIDYVATPENNIDQIAL